VASIRREAEKRDKPMSTDSQLYRLWRRAADLHLKIDETEREGAYLVDSKSNPLHRHTVDLNKFSCCCAAVGMCTHKALALYTYHWRISFELDLEHSAWIRRRGLEIRHGARLTKSERAAYEATKVEYAHILNKESVETEVSF
jgi:hypothetical protein